MSSGLGSKVRPLPNPFDALAGRVVITTIHSFAILLTLFRLFHRIRIRRFSWDDGLAALALIFLFLMMAGEWERYVTVKRIDSIEPSVSFHVLDRIYVTLRAYSIGVEWLSHASLAFLCSRILPPGRRKITSMVLCWACALYFPFNVALWHILCKPQPPSTPQAQVLYTCKPKSIPPVFLIGGTTLVSTLLLVLPMHALYQLNDLPRHERQLLALLTCSMIVPFALSVIHGVARFKEDVFLMFYCAKLLASLSLATCNITVVATALYQPFRQQERGRTVSSGDASAPVVTPTATMDTRINSSKSFPIVSSDFELTRISFSLGAYASHGEDVPQSGSGVGNGDNPRREQ